MANRGVFVGISPVINKISDDFLISGRSKLGIGPRRSSHQFDVVGVTLGSNLSTIRLAAPPDAVDSAAVALADA